MKLFEVAGKLSIAAYRLMVLVLLLLIVLRLDMLVKLKLAVL